MALFSKTKSPEDLAEQARQRAPQEEQRELGEALLGVRALHRRQRRREEEE